MSDAWIRKVTGIMLLLLSACQSKDRVPRSDELLCYQDEDCPSKAYACDAGVCQLGGDECSADGDCAAPPICKSSTGAVCQAGICQYVNVLAGTPCQSNDPCVGQGACDGRGVCVADAVIVCDAPLEPECANDSVMLVSAPVGACQMGRCTYERSEVACPSCPSCLLGCVLDVNGDGAAEDTASGTPKPDDACLACAPEVSRARWTPVSCDDQVLCTHDGCDAVSGCLYVPDDTRCDDDNDYTVDSCDPRQGCRHVCTTSSCRHLAFVKAPLATAVLGYEWPAFRVQINDIYEEKIMDATAAVSLRIVSGTGVLTGAKDVEAVDGVAAFSGLRYDTAEAVTMEASAPNLGTLVLRVEVIERAQCVNESYKFRQSVSGYDGTLDIEIRDSGNTLVDADTISVENDDLDDRRHSQALISFASLFGDGAGQVPETSVILNAKLSLRSTEESYGTMSIHRMLVPWNASTSWDGINNGVQTNGGEALTQADDTIEPAFSGLYSFGVFGTLVTWQSDPSAQHGWVILASGTDQWLFASSESLNQPELTVVVCSPPLL